MFIFKWKGMSLTGDKGTNMRTEATLKQVFWSQSFKIKEEKTVNPSLKTDLEEDSYV